jgi:hypothetical protein
MSRIGQKGTVRALAVMIRSQQRRSRVAALPPSPFLMVKALAH